MWDRCAIGLAALAACRTPPLESLDSTDLAAQESDSGFVNDAAADAGPDAAPPDESARHGWSLVGPAIPGADKVTFPVLAVDPLGAPMVSFNVFGTTEHTMVERWDGSSWQAL